MKKAKSSGIFLAVMTLAQNKNMAMDNRGQVQTIQVQNAQDSIVRMPGELNMMPDVPAMTQSIVNATGSGAAAVTAYFLNEPSFTTTATNNGSGAASVTKTYGDGWTGKGYNQLCLALAPQGGIKCYGFTITLTVTSGGAQDPSGLAVANPTWLMANLVGAYQIPKGFVLGAGARNTQYLSGTMTVEGIFYLNPLCQFAWSVPVGDTGNLVVLTKPLQ